MLCVYDSNLKLFIIHLKNLAKEVLLIYILIKYNPFNGGGKT